MSKKILSICIPTYNRAECLKDCLNSIFYQLKNEQVLEKIEVVISDNASTDNTTEIVKSFQKQFNNILYFKNEKNLGFDRNLAKTVRESGGKYCLTIGDDDAFFDDVILFIIKRLETESIPFYGLNGWGYDNNLKETVLPHPNLNIQEDQKYEKLSDFVKSIKKYEDIVGIFTGMSTQLFLREKWADYKNKDEYLDTQVAHMFILLTIFKDLPYTQIAKPIIKTRSSNVRWVTMTGLETAQRRVVGTVSGLKWIRGKFDLPISNTKINVYFYVREYWFTFKEIIKRTLEITGFSYFIIYYRKIRNMLH
ncbi:glycosyltransferase family 2 protein [Candidatus Gracilibacteria bacterium]|nr:glycosyltransferase family 2 protein [Candidatus Gracilibacteria bacterium]MCF7898671.1 glycosyltransferase family 2 protein [Candidatus Paceibacterota bacterium]